MAVCLHRNRGQLFYQGGDDTPSGAISAEAPLGRPDGLDNFGYDEDENLFDSAVYNEVNDTTLPLGPEDFADYQPYDAGEFVGIGGANQPLDLGGFEQRFTGDDDTSLSEGQDGSLINQFGNLGDGSLTEGQDTINPLDLGGFEQRFADDGECLYPIVFVL